MSLSDGELQRRQKAADLALLNMGITFNVYGHEAGTEKVWPFDIVPRIIDAREWDRIERGLKQRIHALNLFIDDVYNEQQDHSRRRRARVADRHPASAFCKPCAGLKPPRGIWCHITGTDLVRDGDGAVLRARRQSALPLGRVVRAGKPRGDEADVSAGLRRAVDPAGRGLSRAAAARCCNTSLRRTSTIRTSWC